MKPKDLKRYRCDYERCALMDSGLNEDKTGYYYRVADVEKLDGETVELLKEINQIADEILAQAEVVELEGEFTDEVQLREWTKRLQGLSAKQPKEAKT